MFKERDIEREKERDECAKRSEKMNEREVKKKNRGITYHKRVRDYGGLVYESAMAEYTCVCVFD